MENRCEKNIYDLLNDVKTDMQAYDITKPNELELKRMKQAAKQCSGASAADTKNRSVKHTGAKKKLISAACAAALLCGLTFTDAGSMVVYAAGESAAYHISNFMGIDRNLQDYATVVGTSQSDNGYTIRLNEVILDQGSLVVSTDVYKEGATSEDMLQLMHMGVPSGTVYVNGRFVHGGASGAARFSEDGSYVGSVMRYDLEGINTEGQLDIKLVFDNISFKDDSPTGTWKFHFVADGSALAADTVTIPINQSITLENDVTVTFTSYVSNVLSQRIYFKLDGPSAEARGAYNLQLEGTDDAGRNIVFGVRRLDSKKGVGYLSQEILGEAITSQTKALTLTLYTTEMPKESGRVDQDYKAVGEPFTIDITSAQSSLAE